MINISIIVPVYNKEKFLPQCLDGILCQDIENKEIICVDDGSTDGSYQILCDYQNKNKDITIIQQENKGAAEARNQGINKASGKYICFIDADDYYVNKSVLRHMFEAAEANNVDICGGGLLFDNNGELLNRETQNSCFFEKDGIIDYVDFQDNYYHVKYIFNLEFLKKNEIFYPNFRIFEDPPFLTKAMIKANKFYALKEAVYVYRMPEKERRYTIDDMAEWLTGLKEVIILAKENNLNNLMDLCYKKIVENGCRPYFYWAIGKSNKRIFKILGEINDLLKGVIIDYHNIAYEVQPCILEREKLTRMCKENKNVVIYGDTEYGLKVSQLLKAQGINNFLGFAASKFSDNMQSTKNVVKDLDAYIPIKDDTLILVATSDYQMKKEIFYNLSLRNFTNILVLNVIFREFPNHFIIDEESCGYSDFR